MHSRNIPRTLFTITPLIGYLLLALTGCAQQDQGQPAIRPVNVVRVSSREIASDSAYPGEVQARYETTLAFRVPGKVLVRAVEIGDTVQKGQMLARLDPSDYLLARRNIEAQLIAAKAERAYSRDELGRYRDLLAEHTVSQPELDRRETDYTHAKQKVAALDAQLEQTGNQLAYADLLADRDGVVTALEVEAGQVVAAGQAVIKIAQPEQKEIAIDIPEQRVADIALQQEVGVSLWIAGDNRVKGRIREISAAADPLSRTFKAKVALLEDQETARLGMSATVWIASKTPAEMGVPLSAVFTPQNQPGRNFVWLVDESSATVKAVPVQITTPLPEQRVAVAGLTAGQMVVSAGVQRLLEGQAVRLPQQDRMGSGEAGS